METKLEENLDSAIFVTLRYISLKNSSVVPLNHNKSFESDFPLEEKLKMFSNVFSINYTESVSPVVPPQKEKI